VCRVTADVKIREAAIQKVDQRMLAVVSREFVAAEEHCHRSCYRDYTHQRETPSTSSKVLGEEQDQDPEAQCDRALKQAYDEVYSYVRNELFPNPKVLPMTDIVSKLVTCMAVQGICTIKDSTKKHIRRKRESEFAGAPHIFPDDNGKLLLYPDSLSMCGLAKMIHSLITELNNMKAAASGDVVVKAALNLRNEIRKKESSKTWPPDKFLFHFC